MLTKIFVFISLITLTSFAQAQGFGRHPQLRMAHQKVAEAIRHLQNAKNGKIEFGGHRAKAEQALHEAQEEITQAVQFASQHHPQRHR